MKSDDRLGRHVHTFFHEYLTAQRNVSPHTQLSYRDTLKLFLSFASHRLSRPVVDLSLDDLTAELVLAFLRHLEEERGNSVATRNVRLAALHAFFRHVGAHDPLSLQRCQQIVAIPAKCGATKTVDYLERDELEAILHQIDRARPDGRRDYAMLTFTYQTGARVQEVLDLRASDLQLNGPATARLWGKGRKERIIPLWDQTAILLRALLEERGVDPRSSQLVFINMHGRPMTRWGFRHVLQKHVRSAAPHRRSATNKHVHPHMLRHTAAVHMLQAGVDPNVIRDLLGHASSATTWTYARINIETKRKAIESYAPAREEAPPLWRRDKDLLTYLESLGRRPGYVEPTKA
jgi:site-specific recombinase XerD